MIMIVKKAVKRQWRKPEGVHKKANKQVLIKKGDERMEQLLWAAVESINRILEGLTQLLEGVMPGREVHFWTIGLLGMGFFLVAYIFIKLFRKLPFGDTVLALLGTLVFVSGAVLATGLDDVAAEQGTSILAMGAAGITGFFILFALYSILTFVFYAVAKAVKRSLRRRKEAKGMVE